MIKFTATLGHLFHATPLEIFICDNHHINDDGVEILEFCAGDESTGEILVISDSCWNEAFCHLLESIPRKIAMSSHIVKNPLELE